MRDDVSIESCVEADRHDRGVTRRLVQSRGPCCAWKKCCGGKVMRREGMREENFPVGGPPHAVIGPLARARARANTAAHGRTSRRTAHRAPHRRAAPRRVNYGKSSSSCRRIRSVIPHTTYSPNTKLGTRHVAPRTCTWLSRATSGS